MILDQFGNPVPPSPNNWGFFDASKQDGRRPSVSTRNESIRRLVTDYDYRTIVSASRKLYGNFGVPKGAIGQKAMYSIGRAYNPNFLGADTKWGELAYTWLTDEWYKICDIRGGVFDFKTDTYLDSVSIDRDGDFGILLTTLDGKYPAVQRIPNHRIGNGVATPNYSIVDGKFAGNQIYQGVIFNGFGRPIAYRVIDEDEQGYSNFGKYQDIPASSFIHVFDPEWYDQARGFPAFTHALADLVSAKQSQEYEQIAGLMCSAIGLVETNETGAVNPYAPNVALGDVNSATTGASPLTMETYEGGMIRYFKANSGAKLNSFTNPRPSKDWDTFQDRIIRSSLLGINWPYAMAWKSQELSGTGERSEIQKAQSSVNDRQDMLDPSCLRQLQYAIACAIQLGLLPKSKDWMKWGFTKPAKISIDHGRDSAIISEEYALGIQNMTAIQDNRGLNYIAVITQRATEAAQRKLIQKQISTKYGVEITDADMGVIPQVDQLAAQQAEQGKVGGGGSGGDSNN